MIFKELTLFKLSALFGIFAVAFFAGKTIRQLIIRNRRRRISCDFRD